MLSFEPTVRRLIQEILMRRVTWPLLSQYVFFFAIHGSSIAVVICPEKSVAREVTVCSPDAGLDQSRYQIFQANFASSLWSIAASSHGPSSIFTSTLPIGAPQAAPVIR